MAFLFKLRLLNGPLQGRELLLPEGTTTLGKGDVDLQVALQDDISLVELSVNERGIFLRSAVPCWVDGQPLNVSDEEFLLPLEQVIDIAGQILILGDLESKLSSHVVPEREITNPDPLLVTKQNQVNLVDHQKYSKQNRLFWITGLLTLIIFVSMIFCFFRWLTISKARPSTKELTGWLQTQLKNTPGLVNLHFNMQQDGTIHFNGYCTNSVQLNKLLLKLRNYGLYPYNPPICQDQLCNNVRYVLHLFGYDDQIDVSNGTKPGTVEIRGSIQANERWGQVVKMLTAMPGLDQWQVVNQNDEQIKSLITNLRKVNLLKKLSVTRIGDRLILSGLLDKGQQQILQQQVQKFVNEWTPAPKVIYQNIKPTDEQNNLFPATIVSIGGNEKTPFIELSNGLRLQVGARLPSGYQITHIDGLCGVELSKEGQLIHIPINL